jgi:glycosyltransferase involved in cell wall biosynthesis
LIDKDLCRFSCYDSARVRILIDYRPALAHRTGVGEYVHRLAASLSAGALSPADTLILFSSSLRDRLPVSPVPGATCIDARVPVRVLNAAWHRLEWPPAEWFAGPIDVTHSMHPLLMPARAAARIVTIHDLYFLDHSAGVRAEIRRDYARLAPDHARRADRVVVISDYTRRQVIERLGIAAEKVVVCRPGAPDWTVRDEPAPGGSILFIGTVEPRKNVAGLAQAYRRLALRREVPPLVIAGRLPAEGLRYALLTPADSPQRGRIEMLGYVSDERRQQLYREASMLVIPSLDEGFGIPALEAMTIGLPVVASNRGALPEVVGDAGLLVDPDDRGALATAMERVLDNPALRRRMSEAGVRQARQFDWDSSARTLYAAYQAAVAEHRGAPR